MSGASQYAGQGHLTEPQEMQSQPAPAQFQTALAPHLNRSPVSKVAVTAPTEPVSFIAQPTWEGLPDAQTSQRGESCHR